ncbi:MAG: transcriptional regulator [Actinobacteria bacterium HGW-Actinobacteria-1]|jgi:nitrogen regulatory protein P-II 1|nr:MAG: transcriptional regulator [Actinobacteria bacterium HGW-Actinobacteria-1]
MKRIEAIIRQQRVWAAKEALAFLGYTDVTEAEVRGHGIQGGVTQQWRGTDYTVDLLPKSAITVVVNDDDLDDCVDVIVRAARTGLIGDGKILVTPVESVVRIRTGKHDPQVRNGAH